MGARYVKLDDTNISNFLKSQHAVLVLGKSTCGNCHEYDSGIVAIIDRPEYGSLSFGKVILDEPGSIMFKRNNPWISQIELLPYTVLYANGLKVAEFAASNVKYLEEKLKEAFS